MAPLPTISYASAIVGFMSFTFTFFTLVRVFWDSLRTMFSAGGEVHVYLDNLRTELYGEREYFKSAVRHTKSKHKADSRYPVSGETIKILNDTVKSLSRQFKRLEEPFLAEREPSDKEVDMEKSVYALRGNYAMVGLRQRYDWLKCKDEVIALMDQVTRIQTRRIAYETSCTIT